MAVLDSMSGRFDESIKADKVNTLQGLIFASANIEKYKLKALQDGRERTRNEKLIVRTIEAFDLYRLEGRNSYGGATLEDAITFISGQYNEEQGAKLKNKFNKNYQDGGALGIWIDTDLNLSPLAKRVANHEITISRYLSIAFLNMFSYATYNGQPTYFHVLERLLDYLISSENNNVTIDIEKLKQIYFNFSDDSTEDHRSAQARALFQYLVGTEYFVDQGNYKLIVHPRWEGKLDLLKSYCNNDFKNLSYIEAQSQFNNRNNRRNYAEVIGNTRYEKEITIISEGVDDISYNPLDKNETLLEDDEKKDYVIPTPPYSRQLIFSGAPGTGKSYELNKLANEYFKGDTKTYYKRVTFHPNMNYGQFVGVYKPFPSDNESAPITYKFVPGILLQQLVEAYKNPKHNYLVLIEEINRANTASVFGDTFQLLDRTKGESDYPIAISEDIRTYLEEQNILSEELTEIDDIKVKNKLENEGLYFPKNFYIWASMNEADQGVLPMDTAFKRRWDFEKFDINDLGEEGKEFFSDKVIKTCNEAINWNKLRMAINSKLLDLNVPEGKLMGPYFISKDILEDEEKLTNAFETKVLMYLLEDAVKTRPTALFAIENSEKHYGALVDKFNELGIAIFRDIDLSNDIVPLEEVLSEGLETTNLISEFDINKYEDGLEFNQKDILTYLIEESNKLSDTKVLDNVQGSNGLYFIEAKMDIPEKQAGKNKYLHVKNSSFKGSGNVTICLRVPYEEAKEYPNTTMTTGNPGKFTTEIELKSKEDVDSIIELIEKSIDYTSSLYK